MAPLVLARKTVGVIGGVGGLQMLWCRRGQVAGGSGLAVWEPRVNKGGSSVGVSIEALVVASGG